MNEQMWEECQEPANALMFADGRISARKLRLFAVECCRRVLPLMKLEDSRRALDVAESYAEGVTSRTGLVAARRSATPYRHRGLGGTVALAAAQAAYACTSVRPTLAAREAVRYSTEAGVRKKENKAQIELLRDIFGNPFLPFAFDPSWRTSTAAAIAKGMYDSRDFTAMPLLADALQDAGCADDRILDHCRGPGPHVKGCWVVDLVLGKE